MTRPLTTLLLLLTTASLLGCGRSTPLTNSALPVVDGPTNFATPTPTPIATPGADTTWMTPVLDGNAAQTQPSLGTAETLALSALRSASAETLQQNFTGRWKTERGDYVSYYSVYGMHVGIVQGVAGNPQYRSLSFLRGDGTSLHVSIYKTGSCPWIFTGTYRQPSANRIDYSVRFLTRYPGQRGVTCYTAPTSYTGSLLRVP